MKTYVQTTFGEVELHLYHRRERALRLARRLGAYLVQNVTYALLDMHRRWASGHPAA